MIRVEFQIPSITINIYDNSINKCIVQLVADPDPGVPVFYVIHQLYWCYSTAVTMLFNNKTNVMKKQY